MSQEILDRPTHLPPERGTQIAATVRNYAPLLTVGGGLMLFAVRSWAGPENFISDVALMMLALVFYLIAAVFYLTNFYAPFRIAELLGLWATVAAVFLNLSSWLVRWAAAYDREVAIFTGQGRSLSEMPWAFRYIPFANLYDLSLAFAFGAGITTLLVMRRKSYTTIAALSLPLAALILVLARFIGSELIDLPPVLDSYWRPIHVGIASLSYGIALVCFSVAVLYLLKDGVKPERMAVWSCLFTVAVFATIGRYGIFAPATFGTYAASTFAGDSRMALPLRADIPYVGWLLVAAGVLVTATILLFIRRPMSGDRLHYLGHWLLRVSLVVQGAGIVTLVYQITNAGNVIQLIDKAQYEKFAVWLLQQENVSQAQINLLPSGQLYAMTSEWVARNGTDLHLSLNANPVEFAALLTAFAATFFVVLFSLNTERIRGSLPDTARLDGLMYKLGGTAFAGLALLLMTGAVWANESWGRYWGWDAKEVGALVAWLTYAGFLHSRIAYGCTGRHSAYLAIVAFMFVVFTYLGVSYLLPGLHSYA